MAESAPETTTEVTPETAPEDEKIKGKEAAEIEEEEKTKGAEAENTAKFWNSNANPYKKVYESLLLKIKEEEKFKGKETTEIKGEQKIKGKEAAEIKEGEKIKGKAEEKIKGKEEEKIKGKEEEKTKGTEEEESKATEEVESKEEEEEEEEEEYLQVAIPVFKNVTALEIVGPYEVLHLLPHVKVVFVSHAKDSYATDQGILCFQATATFDEVPEPDVIVVPGGAGVTDLLTDAPLLDWIRRAHETSMYTTSVCSGSLLLGAAGILKGVKATTHWCVWHMLPEYGAKPVYARIAHDGKIITAAGMTAGIDMALKLAALVSDETSARAVQLMMEYDPQPPFHCGSVDHATPETISRAKHWLENLNGWTICPDTACFFHSSPEVEDITDVPTEEAALDLGDGAAGEAAPSEPKPVYTAPFVDYGPAERPAHLPQPPPQPENPSDD